MIPRSPVYWVALCLGLGGTCTFTGETHSGTRTGATYQRLKTYLDAIPAIDTHDHLAPFAQLRGLQERDGVRSMTLEGIWKNSYYSWIHPLTSWTGGESFDAWWTRAKEDFANARATSFYRYQLPAFEDLYGVDFETLTNAQARELNARIWSNYQDHEWLYSVITEKANIELMLNDPFWARLDMATSYPFEAPVLNVTTVVRGFHPSEFEVPGDDPYRFAKARDLPVKHLEDYLHLLDRLYQTARSKGTICTKTTLAYNRTLRFEKVPRERAEAVFGRTRTDLTGQEIRDFEDFIMWRLVELSAKYDLPFQIHTGQARIQGSNPMLLVDLIAAHPKTKFILFHGGFPWVGETGVIVMRYPANVWVDSV